LQAAIAGPTEVASLAGAFNSMTAQLRDLIGSLEQRVADRTRGLQTAAEVARATISVLDPDELLRQAVDLVRERFGLYYVGLFLLDEEQRFAVLRAGTGEAGQQMMSRGHKLEVGGDSMVGQCVAKGEARIALDVGVEATRFSNPLLPDTRTETALPLRSRGRTIGAMTVQSVEEAAFDEADIAVMQTMADQVAAAIDNAQLFAQTEAALEETAQAKEKAEAANKALEAQMWQTAGQAQLSDKMRGEQDIPALANSVIQQLCHYLQAQIGALYVTEDNTLNLVGSYAYASKNPTRQFKFGEGLVGQAALEKQPIIVADVPDDYITVRSGLGETGPRHIMVLPFVYEGRVVGVAEMGTLAEFSPAQIDFVQTAMTNIAIAFTTAQARARIDELLAESQQQAEELQTQGEELRVMNEELEAQTESLRASEAKLKEKQAALDRQNRELKVAQQELEKKAEELALTSKYKSEFLANMSHELRTPLNSLLILARMLADNEEGNLSEEQVESAQIVFSSGNDLLNLINDILDLSKVEAGKMAFNIEPMLLSDLVTTVRAQFAHVAEEKGLDLNIKLADGLPASIKTDPQRVDQIVKNLLSNAFKFTSEGSVSLNIYRPDAGVDLSRSGLDPTQAIAISVTDTGIGISAEQQKIVFEAFQQADGSTGRQYGGTGLGLSISRELATRLGGQIGLESEPGRGSTFTLYLPLARPASESRQEPAAEGPRPASPLPPSPPPAQPPGSPAPVPLSPPDDRADLRAGSRILLVIEDDPKFARIVYDYAHEKAFQCLIAGDGKTGLELVRTYQLAAIILDLNLPDISGWEVLEALKHDPGTRHIPVHIISVDDETLDAYRKGVMGYLTKPVSREDLAGSFQRIEQLISREIKTLLLVEDDAKSRRSIKKLLGGSDVQISEADSGRAALDSLKARHFDCMILDLNLPDMTGFEVLSEMNDDEAIARCPVIVYTGRDLTPEENLELMKYADSVIVKGVKSPERLLDETALFLHRVVADMSEDKQQTIKQLYNADAQLEGKKILIVDDDMRNSFALSRLLSDKGVIVKIAATGQKALDLLAEDPDIDLVLMDVMMPVMDGYETTRRVRARQEFRRLPILALTAKAMKGDREKCLAAGANDYLPKPVDVDRLFSMLRVWLYQ
jgi:CheY-like chemotaxis protein/putative methionine-R-sulfoxide reductase with GAF domain